MRNGMLAAVQHRLQQQERSALRVTGSRVRNPWRPRITGGRTGTGRISPSAARDSGKSTDIIVYVVVAVGLLLLALLGWLGYRKWAARKRKENPNWKLREQWWKRKSTPGAAGAAKVDDEAMLHQTRVAEQELALDNPRPLLGLGIAAGSKSRKQAAAAREP